jgi:hypothetical protein
MADAAKEEPVDPVKEWEVLMGRVRDLGVDAFYFVERLRRMGHPGHHPGVRATFIAEQTDAAMRLCDDLTAFLKARVAAAKNGAKK